VKKIGIISDTHGFLHEEVQNYFKDCDEIWHGGDFGSGVAEMLENIKPLKGVYGNIDDRNIHQLYPEQNIFYCEKVKVMVRHIGGYPPRYNKETKEQLAIHHPDLFISGHSHILRIMYDQNLRLLYINPGAAGRQGWHKVKTLVTIVIDGKDIRDCKVIELP